MSTDELLDDVFVDGPAGFLDDTTGPSRLRRFVCAMNDGLPLELPPVRPPAPTAAAEPESDIEEDTEENEELQGADAWKAEAMRKWQGLWSGTVDGLKEVFNVDAPTQLAAFDEATRGANPWSTFCELRLDAALMGVPPEDENLFEKCVLNDQLNYLGTALPEAFSGVVGIGTLGNGDSYHLELSPPDGQEEPMVFFFDHETHRYDWAFSVDLESLVYLAALCRAANEERISEDVATQGYQSLRERVSPSWHFAMDERDESFVSFEKESNQCAPLYMFWRSLWLSYLFRQDGHVSIDQVFAAQLNTVLPPEYVPARMDIAARSTSTALYATWRAYLFDEPELEQYLKLSREHPARLARDAARLIDELRGGRKTLGRINDWPALLEKLRAMDLDPRRAEEREAEADAAKAALTKERASVRAELAKLEDDAEREYIAARLRRSDLFGTMLHVMIARPLRSKAKEGVDFLLGQGYSRDNSLYRHEQHDACTHIAAHGDPALQLLFLGGVMHGAGENEDEPMLSGNDLLETLMTAPESIPEAGRKALWTKIEALDLKNPSWHEHSLVRLAGRLRDKAGIPALRSVLAKIPAEGGFETSLKFDTFVGYIAESIRLIGDGSATPELTPFAESSSARMRKARTESALAIAATAPSEFTDAMADRALEFISQHNDGDENAMALFSVAKGKPGYEAAKTAEPMADSDPQVCLAMALNFHDEAAITAGLDSVFTKRAYDDKYTIAQRRLGLIACKLFGLTPDVESLRSACGLDLNLDRELAALGGFKAPRRITWFDTAEMDSASLQDSLRDASVFGRCHAARRVRGDENARASLESAVQSVMLEASKLPDDQRYLLKEAIGSLVALPEAPSTVALFDEMLRRESRDIKDPILRHLPPWPGLKAGMEFVRDENWGWQEGASTKWLEEHG